MNYRKLYQDYFNVGLTEKMEIHHIDGNHENNDINNLVALPRKLHQEYHRVLQEMHSDNMKINIDVALKPNMVFRYNLDKLKDLCDVLEQIKPYLIEHEFLIAKRGKNNGK